MAILTVSVDTSTRSCVLTVDGQIVPATSFAITHCPYVDMDGESHDGLGVSYAIETTDANGLKSTQLYYLPYESSAKEIIAREDDTKVLAEAVGKYLMKSQ